MANKQLLQSAGDGTTVPAGYVGEVLNASVLPSGNLTTNSSTFVNITGASISLTAGTWLIFAGAAIDGVTATTQIDMQIYNTATSSQIAIQTSAVATNGNCFLSMFKPVSISSSQTIVLQIKNTSGSSILVEGFGRPYFTAVRIA